MPPADNHVTTVFLVAVAQKIAALKFKLNADALPVSADGFAQGFAVGKRRLQVKDDKAEPSREHAKDKDHAGFIHRLMHKFRQQNGPAVKRAVMEDGPFADAFAPEGADGFTGFCCVRGMGCGQAEHVLPVGFDFGFAGEAAEGFRDAGPSAIAGLKRRDAETSVAAVFMHAGNFLQFARDGGPVQQQGRLRLIEAGAVDLQPGSGEGFGESAKVFVEDRFGDAGKTEIAQVGIAFELSGALLDGFDDFFLSHWSFLAKRKSHPGVGGKICLPRINADGRGLNAWISKS